MKTKNLAVGALAAALTLALWWNFLLKPTQTKASKVKAETAVERTKLQPLEAQLAQAQADAAHASTFKAQLGRVAARRAELARARGLHPGRQRDRGRLQHLVAVGHARAADARHSGVASITVGIQIRGTYEQVMDYLGRIAALKRLLVLDNVQFSSAGPRAPALAGAAGGAGTSTQACAQRGVGAHGDDLGPHVRERRRLCPKRRSAPQPRRAATRPAPRRVRSGPARSTTAEPTTRLYRPVVTGRSSPAGCRTIACT